MDARMGTGPVGPGPSPAPRVSTPLVRISQIGIEMLRRLVCLTALTLLACSPPESLSSTAAAAPAEETRPAPAPRVPLTVRETAGVARSGEVLSTGIPLP